MSKYDKILLKTQIKYGLHKQIVNFHDNVYYTYNYYVCKCKKPTLYCVQIKNALSERVALAASYLS